MTISGISTSSVGTTTLAKDEPKMDYFFPTSLKTNGQDYIKFTAYEYVGGGVPTSASTSAISAASATAASAKTSPAKGSVCLPIQSGISDSNMVSWGQDEMNAIDSTVAAAAYQSINPNDGTTLSGASLTQAFDTTARFATEAANLANTKERKEAIALYFAGRAANVNNLLARAEGKVLNPNMELLFQGPALRPFNFAFRLTPRNADEAMNIKDIIRFFKRKMAPIVDDAQLFLKAPHVFKVEYIFGVTNNPNESLNRIKLCALQSCNVDYTPDGNYATFRDGSMTSYGLSLAFTEIEPIYSRDYNDGVSGYKPVRGSIGY